MVKPSGIMWHGSRCVSFHEVANVEEICKAVTDLLSILEVENAVMIEGFYHPVESTNPKLGNKYNVISKNMIHSEKGLFSKRAKSTPLCVETCFNGFFALYVTCPYTSARSCTFLKTSKCVHSYETKSMV